MELSRDVLGELGQQIRTCYAETLSHLGQAFAQAATGEVPDVKLLNESLEALLAGCCEETNFLRLISALHSYDEYTFQHSIGVGLLASRIGAWLGLSDEACQDLLLAGALHDIGKCLVDDRILNKPGRLTPEEFEEIKHHAAFGGQILRTAGLREEIVMTACNHHERMNGSGYPRGLAGEEIDLYSRIVGVADVFHAMTSTRVYRGAQSVYRVLDELLRGAFGELDPQVVLVFVRQMTAFFIGNQVRLCDGTVGTVIALRDDMPTRPLLRCADGFMDLLQRSDLWIEELLSV